MSVGIVTGYWVDVRYSIPGMGKKFFSAPQRPNRLWDTVSLISNGYRELVSQG
jgi:hypothetical protein